MKSLLRDLTPPMLWRCVKALSCPPSNNARSLSIRYEGNYESWDDATRASTGYDAAVILQRTREALLKVKRKEAVYERDSVVFDKPQHAFPLLAGLLRASSASNGRLCVVDFGGSLGSSYFQCRNFLNPVCSLKWLIVDQPAQVACGREDFESNELRFYDSIEECIGRHVVAGAAAQPADRRLAILDLRREQRIRAIPIADARKRVAAIDKFTGARPARRL